MTETFEKHLDKFLKEGLVATHESMPQPMFIHEDQCVGLMFEPTLSAALQLKYGSLKKKAGNLKKNVPWMLKKESAMRIKLDKFYLLELLEMVTKAGDSQFVYLTIVKDKTHKREESKYLIAYNTKAYGTVCNVLGDTEDEVQQKKWWLRRGEKHGKVHGNGKDTGSEVQAAK